MANWAAIAAVGVGAVVIVIGIKNSAGNVCQSITGKPCPAFDSGGTSPATGSVGGTVGNPNTPGNAKSCPTGFKLDNGYCVPVGPSNNPAFAPLIHAAITDALSAGINPQDFVNQINQESGFNPRALSSTGAEGVAQIEPGTAIGWNVNPWDPNAALQAAAQHMAGYIEQFGSEPYALAAYNAGPGSVNTKIPYSQWFASLSAQTRNYITSITGGVA